MSIESSSAPKEPELASQSRPSEPHARSAPNPTAPRFIVLTGNPNCGKTTLFNALTGLRAKVGNYAGVTVERKEGKLLGAPGDFNVRVLDLPGTYSLSPQSLDEQISRDVLLSRLPELPAPSLIVVVVDASNLQRNLYYATQVIELGYPTLIALNMIDVAEENGHKIDVGKLSEALEIPVLPIVASTGHGLPELRREMLSALKAGLPTAARRFYALPQTFEKEAEAISVMLAEFFHERRAAAAAEALLILSNERALASSLEHYPAKVQQAVAAARQRLDAAGVDWRGGPIEARYASVAAIQQAVVTELAPLGETFSDRLDKVLTHKVWGTLVFVTIMALMFQSIFTFAKLPMEALQAGVDWLGGTVSRAIPPGDFNSLLSDGVIAGVGAVIVFLPQILLLFLFIGFLEDTGYMARAAFLMDRLMSKVGLHGKSFIPMLSSFACAIPGIMATRTIESPKDRLVTILVSPLMSCSARLPVYTLLIAACIPNITVLGFFKLTGLTMLAMYLLGIVVALLMAWLFKKTLLKGETPMLIMELPPYKRPLFRVVLRHMWDRSKLFIKRAGTVILGINIVLWGLATYPPNKSITEEFDAKRAAIRAQAGTGSPSATDEAQLVGGRRGPPHPSPLPKERGTATAAPTEQAAPAIAPSPRGPAVGTPSPRGEGRGEEDRDPRTEKAAPSSLQQQLAELDNEEAGAKLRQSFAGRLGRLIEPAIAPLGFDWKMGIGIISSFAAREVFVSTMSTVYNVGKADDTESSMKSLAATLKTQRRPNGELIYTPLTAVTLMVFYVFALQCVSTVAVVRRETNSWKWPAFQWAYMGILAWGLAFVTYRIGLLLGWG